MSSLGYDEALLKKLKGWIKDNTLNIIGPSESTELFKYKADTTDDKPIQLPMIVLRRLSPLKILSTNKKALTFDGWKKQNNGDKGDVLNGIPIQIDYQLDIYTRHFDESDEYVRNFIFNFINYPRVTIEIPYNNSKIEHSSNVRVQSDVDDNSDIPERLIVGQFYRRTISLYIDDAYMFDYKTKDTVKIESIDTEVVLVNQNLKNDD